MKRNLWIGTILSLIVLCLAPGSAPAQGLAEELEPVLVGGRYRVEGDKGNRLARSGFGFLKLSASARLAGMADANVGTSKDIHTIFLNPAGLVHVDKAAYVASYNQWLVETWLGSAGVAYRTGFGVWGVTLRTFQYPDVEVTTPLQPNGTGENLDIGAMSIGLSFAKQMTDKFSMGFKLRWAREKLHVTEVTGTTLDIGTLFNTGFKSLRLGLTMNNLGKNLETLTEDYRLPFYYDMAIAMELFGEVGDPLYLTGAYEHLFYRDFGERDHLGGELWINNTLALRAGYKFRYHIETWSLGAGLKFSPTEGRNFGVDVSYSKITGILDEAPIRLTFSGSF
ncbi:MAG: PorV/PorQ family protein [bacterium]|nr:PorV/PorQ family protein [bacterium]